MSESDVNDSDIFLRDQLTFEKGKSYFICAGSGRGKTSILNFIYGSNLNYEGTISIDGRAARPVDIDLRRSVLSYVFQDFKLFPQISLRENILLKNRLTNHKSRNEIDELIAAVGLSDKADTPVRTLSLGQKQRVAVIRAMCQPFSFLLMDEPFSHLDEANITLLTDIIKREVDRQQAGMIVTSLGNPYHFSYDRILNL